MKRYRLQTCIGLLGIFWVGTPAWGDIIASTAVAPMSTRGGCNDAGSVLESETNIGTGAQSAGARINGADARGNCAYLAEAEVSLAGAKLLLDLVLDGQVGAGYQGSVSYTIDDLVFNGPGAPGDVITTSAAFYLDGSLTSYINPLANGRLEGFTGGSITASYSIQGVTSAGDSISERVNANSGVTADDFATNGGFSSGQFDVRLGEPVTLTVQLTGTVFGGWTGGSQGGVRGGAIADFDSTFWLAAGVPVFDLPAGYTANSTGLGLVNNFIGAAPPVPSPVPEPSNWITLAMGLLLVALRRAGMGAAPTHGAVGSNERRLRR